MKKKIRTWSGPSTVTQFKLRILSGSPGGIAEILELVLGHSPTCRHQKFVYQSLNVGYFENPSHINVIRAN